MGTNSAAVVVCLPVRHFSLIAPTRSLRPGSNAFSKLDFPAPEAPVKTECRPRRTTREYRPAWTDLGDRRSLEDHDVPRHDAVGVLILQLATERGGDFARVGVDAVASGSAREDHTVHEGRGHTLLRATH